MEISRFLIAITIVLMLCSGCMVPPPGASWQQRQAVEKHNAAVVNGVIVGALVGAGTVFILKDNNNHYNSYRKVPYRRGYIKRYYIQPQYFYRPHQKRYQPRHHRRW